MEWIANGQWPRGRAPRQVDDRREAEVQVQPPRSVPRSQGRRCGHLRVRAGRAAELYDRRLGRVLLRLDDPNNTIEERMNILLIGATGQIGFALARRLAETSHSLTVLVRGWGPSRFPGRSSRHPGAGLRRGRVRSGAGRPGHGHLQRRPA